MSVVSFKLKSFKQLKNMELLEIFIQKELAYYTVKELLNPLHF